MNKYKKTFNLTFKPGSMSYDERATERQREYQTHHQFLTRLITFSYR
jgi:hypothetical protein